MNVDSWVNHTAESYPAFSQFFPRCSQSLLSGTNSGIHPRPPQRFLFNRKVGCFVQKPDISISHTGKKKQLLLDTPDSNIERRKKHLKVSYYNIGIRYVYISKLVSDMFTYPTYIYI